MSDRRAVPRINLSVPLTLYDGQTEILCRTLDISPLGVAVAGVPENVRARVLRFRVSLSTTSQPVMCDCFPVGSRPGYSDVWGFQILDGTGDLSLEFRKLPGEPMQEPPEERSSQSDPRVSWSEASGNEASVNCEPDDSERRLQDLYRAALDSID